MDAIVLQEVAGLQAVFLYAAVLGQIYVVLSVLTIRERRATSVSLGNGDSEVLLRRIRAHGNFAEYVPIALILLIGAALMPTPDWFIHACGLSLIVGRLLHACAIYAANGLLRVAGMAATLTVIGAASLAILARTIY